MTMKIAVSLPDELVVQAKAAVADGRAPSVSAYVAEALSEKAQRMSLEQVLDAMDAVLGRPSEAEIAWARAALDGLG